MRTNVGTLLIHQCSEQIFDRQYISVCIQREREEGIFFLILKGYFLKYFYASHNVTATDGTYFEI